MCKRLKKQISFSEHEKDIFDYLTVHSNASSLIKKLVLTHMIKEKGDIKVELAILPKKEKDVVTNNKETVVTPPPHEPHPMSQEDMEQKALIDGLDI